MRPLLGQRGEAIVLESYKVRSTSVPMWSNRHLYFMFTGTGNRRGDGCDDP
jgi:hypothetical protein